MPGQGVQNMKTMIKGALMLPAALCLAFAGASSAQDKAAEQYIYVTYLSLIHI